jgi:hypothetical protein
MCIGNFVIQEIHEQHKIVYVCMMFTAFTILDDISITIYFLQIQCGIHPLQVRKSFRKSFSFYLVDLELAIRHSCIIPVSIFLVSLLQHAASVGDSDQISLD